MDDAKGARPPCLCCTGPLDCGACRGMCFDCYRRAATAIRKGKLTWKRMIALGLATEPKSPEERRAISSASARRSLAMLAKNKEAGK